MEIIAASQNAYIHHSDMGLVPYEIKIPAVSSAVK